MPCCTHKNPWTAEKIPLNTGITVSFRIEQVETEADFKRYYQLRWQLLRAPWGEPEGSETDDIENSCFHVMAVDGDQVIGVARLQFNSDDEAQLRYMAVSPSHEKQGIGRALVAAVEQRARESGHSRIVLHARENAVGFYEDLGYRLIEKSHLLFDEIQHFYMTKSL